MNIRKLQSDVVNDPRFRSAIEASVMYIAYVVLQESASVPETAIRKRTAQMMFRGYGNDLDRMIRLTAWYAVFDPRIQAAVYDMETGSITPDKVDDAVLDGIVRDFWTNASRAMDTEG